MKMRLRPSRAHFLAGRRAGTAAQSGVRSDPQVVGILGPHHKTRGEHRKRKVRAASCGLFALLLAGCGAGQFGLNGTAEPPPAPSVNMAGRWTLATPGGAGCGMNFGNEPGAQEGTIAPAGGCPGNFFTSRHWTLEKGVLTIADHQFRPLARLTLANGNFSGKSNAGAAVTLTR
jgi:hypothetical protein